MNVDRNIANRQIARAAGVVMLALAFSMLVGLLRRVVMANAFGTGLEIEAFTAANRVSETLFNLVAGGALSSAFIPTFTSMLSKDDRRGAWKLASAVGNLLLLLLSLIGILAAVLAPQVVRYLLAPGFSDNLYKEQLTIDLLRLMLPSAVIFGLSGLVMGILNSYQKFFIPALAPAMYSLGMIFGVLVLNPYLGIYGLAWGVLIGAGLHLILQLPALIGLRGEYFPTLGLKYAPVHEVGRLIGPRLIGVAVVQVNFWVNIWLASFMTEGSVIGLTLAFALMLLPQAIIAQSIAIAAMPTFSDQFAREKLQEMSESLTASMRGILLLSIPASVGMILLRREIVIIVYQRGEFDDWSTMLVSWALLWYAAGLVGHSVVELLSRAFYAMHDTKTPVIVGVIAMTLNIGFSILFASIFRELGWLPMGGLALGNSLATGLEMIGLFILMRRRLPKVDQKSVINTLGRSLIAVILMAGIVYLWMQIMKDASPWLVGVGGIVSGGILYALSLYVMKVPELQTLQSVITKRFRSGF